jgi:hypothetical protein
MIILYTMITYEHLAYIQHYYDSLLNAWQTVLSQFCQQVQYMFLITVHRYLKLTYMG